MLVALFLFNLAVTPFVQRWIDVGFARNDRLSSKVDIYLATDEMFVNTTQDYIQSIVDQGVSDESKRNALQSILTERYITLNNLTPLLKIQDQRAAKNAQEQLLKLEMTIPNRATPLDYKVLAEVYNDTIIAENALKHVLQSYITTDD